MVWRIVSAFAAGALIGWERETHGRAAGLRTTILTCVAATLAMLISAALFTQSAGFPGLTTWRPDPARLGAGVLTGIGFLGGGAILRHGNFIRGVTTAACLWFATVIGLGFGAGLFALSFIGLGVALLTLNVVSKFERHIRTDAYASVKVWARFGTLTLAEVQSRLEKIHLEVTSIKMGFCKETNTTRFNFTVRLKKQEVLGKADETIALLNSMQGVIKASWA